MSSIAIIPARSGSKRIPLKNVREFNGVPNIVRAVELAKKSNLFEKVIVSTDSQEIANLAISAGADVPFLRSEKLSDDVATTIEVIQDVFSREPQLTLHQFACCIYPVTPLLKAQHLVSAYNKLCSTNVDYVLAGLEDKTSVYRHFEIDQDGKIEFIFPQYQTTRTQDLKKTYSDGGQFYFGKTSAWIQGIPILSSSSEIIEFKNTEIVDIDNWDDWKLAESLVLLKDREDR
jgi:pseudaminic acid cytidylyltransferase